MTDQGWPGQGNQPSGNGFPSYGSAGNQPGDQYGSLFGQGHSGQPSFDQPQFGQPSFEQPSYGQPSFEQPQFGQPSFEQPQFGQPSFEQPQFGQPSFEQTQYGQPQQFGQPSYGQASYGQAPGGWNGQTPGGFGGGQPPKKNWLLFGGIGAGVIILVLVVALILQGLNKGGDTSPPATPSAAPTDSDGIPVIPIDLFGKNVPDKVGNFERSTSGDQTYDNSTSMIYRDRSARPTISVLGSFTRSDVARSVTRGLQDRQRIGDFICGQSPSAEVIYCAAKTSDGSIYFFSSPETTTATLGELANGVIAGSK